MTYTMEEKYELIEEACLKSASKNPVVIAKEIMKKDYVNMHGPEHHLLDGAAFLTAYKNAGGNIDLKASIERLAQRSILMPGATCGNWGVCGASSSIGAALSIIHGVGPLSSDQYYKDDMEYTSRVLKRMSLIGGPRCCKRHAFIALSEAVLLVKEKYNVNLELDEIKCEFSDMNSTCLKSACPFHQN